MIVAVPLSSALETTEMALFILSANFLLILSLHKKEATIQ